jgi:GNAT superfamily N-acetyltransferase
VSETAPLEPGAPPARRAPSAERLVRLASHGDVAQVAGAVRELLLELGGTPTPIQALEEAARALVEDPHAGALLVAEVGGELVGMLGVSWQIAVRIPGRYALIQELWVHPSHRGSAIGGELLAALVELAHDRDVGRIEVGLPSERFPSLRATQAFYLDHGFTPIGVRMRRLLT